MLWSIPITIHDIIDIQSKSPNRLRKFLFFHKNIWYIIEISKNSPKHRKEKTIKKKFLAVILCVVIGLGITSSISMAQTYEKAEDITIGSPVEGVRYIQQKMEQVYALYRASDKLEFHYYEGLDHDYLPEEYEKMLAYFDSHL